MEGRAEQRTGTSPSARPLDCAEGKVRGHREIPTSGPTKSHRPPSIGVMHSCPLRTARRHRFSSLRYFVVDAQYSGRTVLYE